MLNDIGLQTLESEVTHDLGELAHTTKRVPRLRDAQRFAAARARERGISMADADATARQAIRDYRALQRVKTLDDTDTIERAYVSGRGQIEIIGVRVEIDLTYRRRPPPGAKTRSTILVNARPGMTIEQVIAVAVGAWNARSLQVPHGFASGSKAAGTGRIVQIIEGGWAHAQV